MGSAGYCRGRAWARLVRLSHYLIPAAPSLWLLLYAGDGLVTGRSGLYDRSLLLHLFLLRVLGTPMKWENIRGGVQVEWVGYLLDLGRFEIGIAEGPAAWAGRWLTDKAAELPVPLGEFREGFGRLTFIAGPPEHLRPLLGPLFARESGGPCYARPFLPAMISIIMDLNSFRLPGRAVAGLQILGLP